MMGRTHASTGAAAWLVGCAAAAAVGHPVDNRQLALGTGLFAFGAVWPDIDQRFSTVARSLDWPTMGIAWLVGRFGAWLHAATRTRRDRRDEDGHRTITHTLIGCALTVLLFGWLADQWHPWGPLVVVFWMVGTGVEAVFGNDTKQARAGTLALTLAITAGFWVWPPPSGWWIGWAVGGGALVHCLGDSFTDTRVPLFFPLTIKGCRWYCVGAPRWLRFSTGEGEDGPEDEIWGVSLLASAAALAVMAYFTWPGLFTAVAGYLQTIRLPTG